MLKEEVIDIKRYVSPYLLEFREYNWVYTVLNKEFDFLWQNIERVLDNFFIETMEERQIQRMEQFFEIVPDKTTQSLSFRRERIKNRWVLSPPFTVRFLRSQFDSVIGVGAYELVINENDYTIYLESSAINQNWYNEILFTMNKIKPCNMIFVNKPLLKEAIVIEEQQESCTVFYNYILGSWRLQGNPFINRTNQRIVKDVKQVSLQKELLNDVAEYVGSRISKVKLNNSVMITDFNIKKVTENMLLFEYVVKQGQIKEDSITNVKVLNEEDNVLSDTTVYVPVTDDIIVKHTIRVKEGT